MAFIDSDVSPSASFQFKESKHRSLTSWLCARKMRHEYEKHRLVSIPWSWHVGLDGSGVSTATGGRQGRAGFQSHDRRWVAGEPERLSRQMGSALFLYERFHERLHNGGAQFSTRPGQV